MGDSASFKFTWKIEKFSKLTAKKVYSEIFTAGKSKWRLLIFPKGNNVDHLSIYIEVADSTSLPNGWSRDAAFGLAVINQFNNSATVRKDTQHVFNARESDWGFTSFLPLSKLKDPAVGYLVNDTLTVETEVHVRNVVHYSKIEPEKEVVKDGPKLPKQVVEAPAKQVPLPQQEAVDTKAKVQPPTVTESPSLEKVKAVVQTVAPAGDHGTVKESPAPPAIAEEKILPKDPSSEPIHSSPNVQIRSKNLLTEISSRTRTQESSSSDENPVSSQASRDDFVHQKKEALQGFFNMSLEAIQQANAFGNVEGIILALVQHANTLQEKTILDDLASRLAEFRDSIPSSKTTAETAQARRTSLAGKTTDLNARLEQRQKELSSLEAKFSRLSEEEAKLQAEIQRLIIQKEELLSQKNSAAIELENANLEASKDLKEWRSLEGEIKQANAEWRVAKEKLALANVRWKLFKEDLGLGKLNIS
ncbi:MATH domain and coiled-coil domain-containing protein At3g58270 [Ricinus communis]|uniref:MATH domain-containing protein n=1 Tax=Ricinus communis TaxID=3988 RepID=B9SNJ1_RICCO|nr:MATH domain and coiled-coil domain-containing protein At3g58270 [Ricinus communis]EEF34812.1 conserved hypothetical protein [Ricinus communis]|eukprot:XP_002527560.1 MATH domain and coiled-coil domain-containing protein At3g58270 [Ricinus communis]